MRRRDPTRRRVRSPAALALALVVAASVSTAATLDDYFDAFRDALTPAVTALFDDVRADLAATAAPFPARVRARLRPFFDGTVVDGVALTPATVERGRYTVDAESSRRPFALLPPSVVAITVGDVVAFAPGTARRQRSAATPGTTRNEYASPSVKVAFAPGEYQPDCVEGVALIAHELVHVAQFHVLGRDRFLERYFLTDTLRRQLGGGSGPVAEPTTSSLEVAAHCRQAEVCRALARAGTLPACRGRQTPICPACRRNDR